MKPNDIEKLWEQIRRSPLRSIIFLCFSIIFTVGGIWTVAYVTELGRGAGDIGDQPEKNAELKIIDVVVTKPKPTRSRVEVKYINTGERVAFLTEVVVNLLERHGERPVSSGFSYDLLIDSNANIKKITRTISPEKIGVVNLVLATSLPNNLLKLQVVLVYGDDQKALSDPFNAYFN